MGPVLGGRGGALQPPPNLGTDRDMYWNNPPQQGNKPNATFNWGEKDMVWNTSDYNKVMIETIVTFNVHMLNSVYNIWVLSMGEVNSLLHVLLQDTINTNTRNFNELFFIY
jgi:hypothetical protein